MPYSIMSEIKAIEKNMNWIRWMVVPAVILTCLGNPMAAASNCNDPDISLSIDAEESNHLAFFQDDFSLVNNSLSDFEIEEVEGDDDELHTKGKFFATPIQAPVPNNISSVYLPAKKEIKLFILFHSWKSFLFIF